MSLTVGFADATDPRVNDAVARLVRAGTVKPVLVGRVAGPVTPGVDHVATDGGDDVELLARLVAEGGVDVGVAGSLTPSPDVLRSAIRGLRGSPGDLVFGCFEIGRSDAWTTYADCAVVPEPDAGELAEIAIRSADHHRRLFDDEPRVAMLSFSTGGAADHARVRLVREATGIVRRERPDLLVDGELQFDVAIDADVARRKAPDSLVAGRANVLVFPSLEAANIAYKIAERLGGATALGAFILGLSRPWVDVSRGCSSDDIVAIVDLLAAGSFGFDAMGVAGAGQGGDRR